MNWTDRIAGRDLGVLGLGRTGLAVVRALAGGRSRIVAFDDKEQAIEQALALGAVRPDASALPGLAALVVSPGIPLTHPAPHPVISAARASGVPLISDLDLLAGRLGERRVVGITGTNGKSTTTALVHHLLTTSGRPAVIGGNIGIPVLDLDLGPADTTLVLELSSYQLDLLRDLPVDIAVWTNLSPDHLDRHGNLENYTAVKERIFRHGRSHACAVIGVDDPASRAALARLTARDTHRIIPISGTSMPGVGVGVVDGRLIDASDKTSRFVTSMDNAPALRGAHNHQNAAAAYAAVRALGLAPKAIASAMASFPGLPHRMERVAEHDGVAWVNDSKATNPDAAAKSLAAFDRIVWIAGGKPKPGGFKSLVPVMRHVSLALLIGEAAEEIAADLGDVVTHRKVGTLEAAVAEARKAAVPGDTVLLAPACASFDQFKDYEARGDRFRALASTGGQAA
ncbi:MAG TPA: UDP-N-acetylmuramoyl-L-alanine--D-glutamate ligase [Geminicoccus sp.]|jgi:UDP-N-acetylmuramoylalanine--D-glutamate ligase|uniref:UDP-N-acetylmuramoyl-L-alanine--D-glutamate ligase n=1 Tax=Geminicoccus sp. TaxID=2024832 RepID=UPI002E320252|nr:UDP-N-acetylmuramoyl-L-alanine--D-glutamate ligase [Geminicoccus sp.]HEX2527027.1 UDP-N-acetylmuramoyl-L-alanine--D-glutamate ligase [Geminicoccus sp.]